MIASAPGKLVLSGAYVVLDGAPALVTAVDRRAVADAARRADYVSPELRAAFGESAPFVDTSSMRIEGRKIGLGSSAAAVVAALCARRAAMRLPLDDEGLDAVAQAAFEAHRAAQGGGSGIDVIASVYGRTLLCQVTAGGPPVHRHVELPPGLVIEVWGCPESASTAALLGRVRALSQSDPGRYRALTAPAAEGALHVAEAFLKQSAAGVLIGVRAQARAMMVLGEVTEAPIFPPYLRELFDLCPASAVVCQSGAGGGDIALFLGLGPSPEAWRGEAERRGLRRLDLKVDAPGARIDGEFAETSTLAAHIAHAARVGMGAWQLALLAFLHFTRSPSPSGAPPWPTPPG